MAELFDEIFLAKDFKYFMRQPEGSEPVFQEMPLVPPKTKSEADEGSSSNEVATPQSTQSPQHTPVSAEPSEKAVAIPSRETSKLDSEELDHSVDFNFKEVSLPEAVGGNVTPFQRSKELEAALHPPSPIKVPPKDTTKAEESQPTDLQQMLTERATPATTNH